MSRTLLSTAVSKNKLLKLAGCVLLLELLFGLASCATVTESLQDLKPTFLPELAPLDKALKVSKGFETFIGYESQTVEPTLQAGLLGNQYYVANNKGHVKAIDNKGHIKWAVSVDAPITAGIAVDDRLLVVGTRQGNIVALSPKDGVLLWKYALGASITAPSLIAGNYVVNVASDGSVTALDIKTGQLVWAFDLPKPSELGVHGNAPAVLYDDDNVIVSSATGRVYGLDLATGRLKWDARVATNTATKTTDKMLDIVAAPLLIGHQLYTVSYQGQITATSISKQRTLWQKEASSLRSMAEGLGNIYVAGVDGVLTAYDQHSGNVVWQQKLLAPRRLSNPVVLGRYLFVGDGSGYIHIIEQVEGKLVGRIKTSGAVNVLTVFNDTLLVQTADGYFSIWQAN